MHPETQIQDKVLNQLGVQIPLKRIKYFTIQHNKPGSAEVTVWLFNGCKYIRHYNQLDKARDFTRILMEAGAVHSRTGSNVLP